MRANKSFVRRVLTSDSLFYFETECLNQLESIFAGPIFIVLGVFSFFFFVRSCQRVLVRRQPIDEYTKSSVLLSTLLLG